MEKKNTETMITQDHFDNFKVKVIQDNFENINVKLNNNIGDPLNVSVTQNGFLNTYTKVTNPIQVEIIKNIGNDFVFYESHDLALSGRGLLVGGLIGVLYGIYDVRVTSLFGITIQDKYNHIAGLIGLIIFIEIIIFLSLCLRDFLKNKTNNISKLIGNKTNLDYLILELKKAKKEKLPNINEIENQIERLKNENAKIGLQLYQKNIIYYGFKIIYPLSVGIIGIISLGKYEITRAINKLDINYLYVPLAIIVFFFIIVRIKPFLKFIFKIGRKKVK
ncbi:MAG: hypothetical protein WC850_01665 [Candidatus Gracilibacteria bacterium]